MGAPALTPDGDIVVGLWDGTLSAFSPEGLLRWSVKAASYGTGSPVIGPDGTLYFGGDILYALNPDGTQRWPAPGPDSRFAAYVGFLGSPVLGPDGAVYVAGLPYTREQRRLYCLEPDGSLRWQLARPFCEGPILGNDGTLFITQEFGGLLAVNPDGTIRGEGPASFTYSPGWPPALTPAGNVLVPLTGNSILLGALQSYTPDGAPGWMFETDGGAGSSPVVAPDGTIYCGFGSGRVMALEADGRKRWEYRVDVPTNSYEVVSTPACAADRTLYFTCNHGLFALRDAGELLWRFDAGTNRLEAPLIGPDGTVYFGGSDETRAFLFAVHGQGGALADGGWPMFRRNARHQASQATFPGLPGAPAGVSATLSNYTDRVTVAWTSAPPATHYEVWRSSTPDVASAMMLAGSVTGTLQWEDRTAAPQIVYYYFVRGRNAAGVGPWAGPAVGARRQAGTGEAAWIFPTGGSLLGSPAVAPDGTVYFASSDGKMYAADTNGQPAWAFSFGGATAGAPIVGADGTIYFPAAISRSPAPETNALFALNPDGQLRWKRVIEAPYLCGVALGSTGTLYVALTDYYGGDRDGVVALDASGQVLWRFANGRTFTSIPAVGVDGTVYVGSQEGWVHALDPSGQLRWECFTEDAWLRSPVIGVGGLLFCSGGDLHAVNTDGQPVWTIRFQQGADSGASCVDATGILYAQAQYTYYSIDPATWRATKFNLPDFNDRLQQYVLRDVNGTLYLAAWNGMLSDPPTGRMYALSPQGNVQWVYSLYQVSFGTPTLAPGGMLYVPGSDGKLHALRTGAGPDQSAWPQPLHDAQHTSRTSLPLPVPAVPTGVNASQHSRVMDVRVGWDSVLSATGYEIYRAITTNLFEAVLVGSTTGAGFFDDKSAQPEVVYTYWVRATNASGASLFGVPATGVRRQAVPGDLLYEWDLHATIDTAPAIADDGTIYVCANLPLFNAPDEGRKVVALGPDGTFKWQYLTGLAALSSPSIATDGTVYVGTSGALTQSPYESALLAMNSDGTLRWRFVADDAIVTTPALGADGSVFVGSASGIIYRVAAGGGQTWSLNVSNSVSALALGRDGTIYASLGDGRLVAVRPDSRRLWETSAGAADTRALALGDSGEIYVACGYRGLRAFHPDGTLVWECLVGASCFTPPVVGSNGDVIAGNDAGLFGLDSGGTNLWSTATGGGHAGAAALSAAGFIYAANYAAKVVSLRMDGSSAWSVALNDWSRCSPAIGPDGTVYVGGQDGKLRSICGAGALADTAWPMFQHDLRHTGRDPHPATLPGVATGVTASDGTFNDRITIHWLSDPAAGSYEVWRNTSSDTNTAVRLADAVGGGTAYEDRTVVAGTNYFYWVRSGNGVGRGPFSLPDVGYRRIAVPGELIAMFSPNGPGGNSAAATPDGVARFGVGNGGFYALNPDLTERWEYFYSPGRGYSSTAALGVDGTAYFWASEGSFHALSADGVERWSFVGAYRTDLPPALASDGGLIVADGYQTVSSLDESGMLRWQYRSTSDITCAPSVGADGAIFFGTKDGQLYALGPEGSLRWRFRTGGSIRSSPAVGTDGVVYFGSDDRGIYAVGPDGRRRWAAQAGDAVVASPVIAGDGSVVVGSLDHKLYAFGPDGSERWEFPCESAIRGSACVAADGAIYFGTWNGWVYGLDQNGARMWAFNSATNAVTGMVIESPLLLEDRLLVPLNEAALVALAVPGARPAHLNWPQFRHDAQRTARAQGWLGISLATPGSAWMTGDSLTFAGALGLTDHTVARLELWIDARLVAVVPNATDSIAWPSATAGKHLISLRAWDDAGNLHFSPTLTLHVASPPRLTLAPVPTGGWQLSFDSLAGRVYQVEASTDLVHWTPAGEPITSVGPTSAWIEANPPPGESYYRVRVLR